MNNTPEKKLLKSIENNSDTLELVEKLSEVALDSLLEESVIKEIPILGSAVSLFKAGNNIKAYYFTKKIIKFLYELEKIPLNERKEFITKIETKPAEKEKLGDCLLLTLDTMNNIESSTYLGRCFYLFIKGKISEHSFYMYVHVISNLSPHIIEQLKFCYQFEAGLSVNSDALHFLTNLGLLETTIQVQKDVNGVKFIFMPKKTTFGEEFYKTVIRKNS